MMNVNLTQVEGSGDFNTSNDFRRIVLMRNPTDSTTSDYLATASTLDATKSITFTGTLGSLNLMKKITQASSGAVGYVIDYNSTTKVLRYIQPQFADQGIDADQNLTAFTGSNTVTGRYFRCNRYTNFT